MALTAKPWSPGAHEAGPAFRPQRLSMDGQTPPAQPSGGMATSLDSSQLDGLFSTFSQSLQLQGAFCDCSTSQQRMHDMHAEPLPVSFTVRQCRRVMLDNLQDGLQAARPFLLTRSNYRLCR